MKIFTTFNRSISRGIILTIPFFMLFACLSNSTQAQTIESQSNCFRIDVDPNGISCTPKICDFSISDTCNNCATFKITNNCGDTLDITGLLIANYNTSVCFSVCSNSGFTANTTACNTDNKILTNGRIPPGGHKSITICHFGSTPAEFNIGVYTWSDTYDGHCGTCYYALVKW